MAKREQSGLLVKHGLKQGEYFYLDPVSDMYTLGRGPQASIHVNDQGVSKSHASIFLRNGYWVLRDTNSANGTFLNGHRIMENVLKLNDCFVIGTAEFQVIRHVADAPPPPVKKKKTFMTSTVALPKNFIIGGDDEFSSIESKEAEHIRQAMDVADGYKEMAANLLSISVEELEQKLASIGDE